MDIRKGSPTLGKWVGVSLSAENKRQFYVPEGFAHGFYVVSDMAEFVYKCSRFYNPDDELGILFSDADIGVEWPVFKGEEPILSPKDISLPSFGEVCRQLGL